ncbi:MAG TPA: phosphatase PAP2 family protein [Candidatus Pacearchaeota archaeon]|nr:phosphatase PAP2 family protein [Candidatus Pacearchaeota archaeon]
MDRKTKALLLVSGGLDSILSAKILMSQDIDVLGLVFKSYFFSENKALELSKEIGLNIRIIDFSKEHLEIVKNPKFGRGGAMNPCIDCHALMLSYAKEIMEKEGFDFIATGEVLGQRPMSQNRSALDLIERKTGLSGKIFRPLSAKKLPKILAEKSGLVKSQFGIVGRGRKEQYSLAQDFGIKDFPNPGGGCLLTEKEFSDKLKKILDLKGDIDRRDSDLLKIGRHFFSDSFEYIIARNKEECNFLQQSFENGEALIETINYPSTIVLIRNHGKKKILNEQIEIAKKWLIKYSKRLQNKEDIKFKIIYPMKKNLDQYIFEKLNQFVEKSKIIDNIAIFFGHYSGYLLVAVLFYMLVNDFSANWEMFYKATVAGILSRFIFAFFIYRFFPKKRPFIENQTKLLLNSKFTSSFPSGHASFFFAVSMVVYFFNPMLGKIFFLVSSLMGISRVIGGVHWPVDVAFGAVLGIFCGWLVAW